MNSIELQRGRKELVESSRCFEVLKKLSIVVLSYNRLSELRLNLPKLVDIATMFGSELIIVDNSSTDGSRLYLEELAKSYPCVEIVLNEKNVGVAKGRNIGWEKATRAFILNLDDDASMAVEDMRSITEFMDSNSTVGVLSPKIVHAETGASQCDHGNQTVSVANFHGACHIVRLEAYQNVGPLDGRCSFGGEELDYSIRMRNQGYLVLYSPVATVKHNNFQRVGEEGAWRRRQWVYNFTRVFFKHFPFRMALLLASRYFASHLKSGIENLGFRFAFLLIPEFYRGLVSGRKIYQKKSDHVVEFYSNPYLKPEFGNKPLFKKMFKST